MKSVIVWVWETGLVSTFLAGLFVILPFAITLWIMGWVADLLRAVVGPATHVGTALRDIGLRFVANDVVATILGWLIVLAAIWLLGVLVKSTARFHLVEAFNNAVNHVPVIRTIYGPVAQVIGLLRDQDKEKLRTMSVVYCVFGENETWGFLALLASEEIYRFAGQDCRLVYIPTSPLPMTGPLIFLPVAGVRKVDMRVEKLMEMYVSMGVLAPKVVSDLYRTAAAAPEAGATS